MVVVSRVVTPKKAQNPDVFCSLIQALVSIDESCEMNLNLTPVIKLKSHFNVNTKRTNHFIRHYSSV